MKTRNLISECNGIVSLSTNEAIRITGGAEPASGSYAAGYAVGRWFNEMYHIWHYGLTHLADR